MKLLSTLRTASSCILLVLLTQIAFAQGNLKFSQVQYLVLNGTTSSGIDFVAATQTMIIPLGHVYKIENIVAITQVGGGNATTNVLNFTIDDVVYSRTPQNTTSATAGGVYASAQQFPVWLPAGTYVLAIKYSGTGSLIVKQGLSALDFELVP